MRRSAGYSFTLGRIEEKNLLRMLDSVKVRPAAFVFLNFLLPSMSYAINLSLLRTAACHQSPFV